MSLAKFKKACQKIQYQSCAMWPSSDAKIAKTIVFMGNKNVKFSHPAPIMSLLDFFKKDNGFSRSILGRKNKHSFY